MMHQSQENYHGGVQDATVNRETWTGQQCFLSTSYMWTYLVTCRNLLTWIQGLFLLILFILLLLILFIVPWQRVYLPLSEIYNGWRRSKRLTEEQRQFIEESVDTSKIMTGLLSKKLITSAERDKIEQPSSRRDRAKSLMKIMGSKDEKQFHVFMNVVKEAYPAFSQGKAMSVKHKSTLISCREDLVRDLSVLKACSSLYSRGVLDEQDKEMIQSKSTRTEQAEKLLDTLATKPDKSYNVFVEVLREIKQGFLADCLEQAINAEKHRRSESTRRPSSPASCIVVEQPKNERIANCNDTPEPTMNRSVGGKLLTKMGDAFKALLKFFKGLGHKQSQLVARKKLNKIQPLKSNLPSDGVRCGLVNQRIWVLTHVACHQENVDAFHLALKKTCGVSYPECKSSEKGALQEQILSLDPDTFSKFLQNFKEISQKV